MTTSSKAPRPEDELERCPWPGIAAPDYAHYHDTEWGVPVRDSDRLFAKLVLESFQSGLSWLTILRKRDNFFRAFAGFDATAMAAFDAQDIDRLMSDAGIIRNRAKIEAAIANARAYLDLSKTEDFADIIWSHVPDAPRVNAWETFQEVPASTPESKRLSKTLKARGFRFVGPTTLYALMQSSGIVNDHLTSCHRHAACARLQRALTISEGQIAAAAPPNKAACAPNPHAKPNC